MYTYMSAPTGQISSAKVPVNEGALWLGDLQPDTFSQTTWDYKTEEGRIVDTTLCSSKVWHDKNLKGGGEIA